MNKFMSDMISTVAKNIKYFRKEFGLSQESLARKLQYSAMSIRRYENEQSIPSIEVLLKMADLFGCSVENLMQHDFEIGDPPSPGIRKPIVVESDFYFFEDQKYYIYYLSEKASGKLKDGFLQFAEHYDKRRLFLHGTLNMHHIYDCKLVLEDEDSAYIYGTGTEKDQRVFIVLHFPDFGKGKTNNPAIRYRGGIGIVVHKDTHGNQTAQRICLSYKELNDEDMNIRDTLIKFLTGENDIERINVSPQIDSGFCQWVLGFNH